MRNTDLSIEGIAELLADRVLAKLGFPSRPAANRAGLAALYAAWCQGVPFDNARKLIALRANDHGPLPGDSPAHRETAITHPAHGIRARPHGAKWIVHWRSPFAPGGMDCRIDSLTGDAAQFRAYHEETRRWSPFNYPLFVRVHRNDGVLLAVQGKRIFVDGNGNEARGPLEADARLRFLIEEVGLSEALASRVPADVPIPPPPGSETAAARHGPSRSIR